MAGGGGGGGAPDQGNDKNSYYILWVLFLIAVIGGAIWYFFSAQLKTAFIAVKVYEAWALYLAVLPLSRLNIPYINKMIEDLAVFLDIARAQTYKTLDLEIAEALSTGIGEYLRYPVILILIFIMIYTYKTHILMRCTTRYNMKTLLLSQMNLWPQIKIASKVNILNEDLDSGPWGMAMTPLQFCKKYKLINVEPAEQLVSPFAKTQGPEFKIVLNKARAERALSAQLGRSWTGAEALPLHRLAILTILAAKGSRDTKIAQDLIYQLASSAAEGKLDLKGIGSLWKKHSKNSGVQKICQSHAYEFTVFASMLLYAREDGVMASSDFLWVKPLDRRLWYVLNNVGRQTPVAEVGGIFSHWYSELALKRPLSVPDVAGAMTALELALSEIIYVADDKEREEIYKRHQKTAPPVQEDIEQEPLEAPEGLG